VAGSVAGSEAGPVVGSMTAEVDAVAGFGASSLVKQPEKHKHISIITAIRNPFLFINVNSPGLIHF